MEKNCGKYLNARLSNNMGGKMKNIGENRFANKFKLFAEKRFTVNSFAEVL